MRCLYVRLLVAAVLSASGIKGEETVVKTRTVSLGLFKNGLAVVKSAISIPGPGTYRVDRMPVPVHGTLWMESDGEVEARVSLREVDGPLTRDAGANWQDELAGKKVAIYFRDGKIPPVTGTVMKLEPKPDDEAWSPGRYRRPYSSWRTPVSQAGRFLLIQTNDGRVYVDRGMIAYLKVNETGTKMKALRPVFLLSVKNGAGRKSNVELTYLTHGIGWAPSYLVDLLDEKTLKVSQKAVIKNELADMYKVAVSLISGYPSVQFAHVTSPFSLRTTWSNFFAELNRRTGSRHSSLSQVAVQAIAPYQREGSIGGVGSLPPPRGEGLDIYYHNIGKRSIRKGESLTVFLGAGTSSYERIVEWIIPDTRTPEGRLVSDYDRNRNPEKYRDTAWDAIRFNNPFKYPMTTGPAMIRSKGRFNGQRLSYWVNAGEKTILHITKALSIRTRHTEKEEPGKREIVWIAGQRYRKVFVIGELTVRNLREKEISMVVRRRFSGELVDATGNPQKKLREEGAYSVNQRNELIWTFTVNPGKEKALTYRYFVLVKT